MTIEQFLNLPLADQTPDWFLSLDETEQKIFYSMVMYAAKNYYVSLQHIIYAVVIADKKGIYNKVKFGSEVYKDAVIKD